MENAKLMVRVPRNVLARAKQYARNHQTTVTRLVTEYLRLLPVENGPLAEAPIGRRLSGLLSPDVSVKDYYQYLEEKYDRPASSAD